MTPPRYLTKSRFKLALECPTKLYYTGKDKEYRNLKNEDSLLGMLADGGFQVGELAKLMYPDGHEITARDHAVAEAQTRQFLEHDEVVLFEPAIRSGDLFIRIDILVKRGNAFELIEVKSKSYDSSEPAIEGKRGGITSSMLPYIQDVAFQTAVLRAAYPAAQVTSFLMLPDKSKRATIDGLNQLFKVEHQGNTTKIVVDLQAISRGYGESVLSLVNVEPYVTTVLKDGVTYPGGKALLSTVASEWAEAYKQDRRILPVIGSHCNTCEFHPPPGDSLKSGFAECWKAANNWTDRDFEQGTVLDVWNFRGKDKLIAQGVCKLSQVQREHINPKPNENRAGGLSASERQWLQVGGIPKDKDRGGFYLDTELMKREMEKWTYPYHCIDFETAMVALPFHHGMRPYEQVAFQFSHHVIEADGRVRHADEFLLAAPGMFPNYEFTRCLKKALDGDTGTVFMWSHHENTILTTIARQLNEGLHVPSDKDALLLFLQSLVKGGTRAMVDLKQIAATAYFHPATKGSNSIKKVLPAVLQTSAFLRDKYSRPIYGAANGIPSRNYHNHQWWKHGENGVEDPYKILQSLASDLLGDEGTVALEAEEIGVAGGGAAASAYARLQFESLDEKARQAITAALLRYCELDSLAMVMVVEAWQAALANADLA